jgi:signal transduction histidine kinase
MDNNSLFTAAALRHVRLLLNAIRPLADRLDRNLRLYLRHSAYEPALVRALLAATPAAASRLRTIPAFLEQLEYNGRRLAKFNLPPGEVLEVLEEFDRLADRQLERGFAPAREQLLLVSRLVLNRAYYQVREAESQAFFGLYHAENEAKGLDDLLDRLVRIVTRTFGAKSGRLHLLNTPLEGALAHPLYIERGSRNAALIACPRLRRRYPSYWSFPVHPSAVLQLGFATSYPWLPRELAMLHAVGARCREAIDRVRMQVEMRRLEAAARRAEEEERRRIGRDLHDEIGQTLVWLRLQLELLEGKAPAELRERLSDARAVTDQAVEDLRRTIAALSPAVVERLGVAAAIRHLATRFQKRYPAKVDVRISTASRGLSMETQEVLYRAAQEALQNVAKHSGASRVKLLLRSADKYVRLSVQDDGAGFNLETVTAKSMSYGLTGMRERASLMGGKLMVRSAPGKGTTVLLELPRTSAHGDKSCPKSKFS